MKFGFLEVPLITVMVRQDHHERNQYNAVRPEPVEGLNQSFLKLEEVLPLSLSE